MGHLSQFCDVGEKREKAHYRPPKRIQFKSDVDVEAFKERIVGWKLDCSALKNFQPQLYKPMITELVAYLAHLFTSSKELMCEKLSVGFAKDISASESGFVFAETSVIEGTITFSCSSIERKLRDDTESEYAIENEYLQVWCRKSMFPKENYLLWLVLHEFCHLLVGCNNDRHDHEFFNAVDKLARRCPFLF